MPASISIHRGSRRCSTGPLNLAMPDLRLPNFNDSGIVDLSSRSDSYDLAYGLMGGDDDFLTIVSGRELQWATRDALREHDVAFSEAGKRRIGVAQSYVQRFCDSPKA